MAAPGGSAAWIDLQTLTPEGEAALGAWLEDATRPKAMHDAKGPIEALAARGWSLGGLTSDTQLAAYLVKPDQRTYHLDDLVLRNLHRELSGSAPTDGQGMLDFGGDADEQAAQKEMVRATAVRDLAAVLDEQVAATGGEQLLAEVEIPLVDVLARMERTGIAVDVPGLDSLEGDFAAKVAQAQQDAWDAIGGEKINLGSPKQLQEVLFGTLGMPKTKKTKTGWTTDADALTDLFAKTEHPFLEALLRHRDAARLRVTVEGLQKSVADDGRIHTTYLQTIAATGPAQLHRAEPPERPDPHRGGASHPRALRRRRRATSRSCRPTTRRSRCASWRTCPATRGSSRRSAPVRTSTSSSARRCSASSPRTSRPPCAPRSRRCPTASPTACRPSACPSS